LGYFFYRWRRERRIQGLLLIVFWSFVFGLLYIAPMYIAARCPVGFQDEALARMDRAMGIHVPSILRSLEQFPRCQRFLDYCYDTLLFLVTVAIMVPPVCNQMGRAKEYLVAGILVAIASCLTARGYTHLETRLRTQLGPSPAELSPTHAS